MNGTCQQAKCQNSGSLRYRSTAHRPPSKYPQPSKISGYRRDISFDIYLLNVVYLWVKQKAGRSHQPHTTGEATTTHKKIYAGGDLLSHTLPSAVPSALVDLASGFGMGPGVTPPLTPPTKNQAPTNPTTSGGRCHARH